MIRRFQIRELLTRRLIFEAQAETFLECLQSACDAGYDLTMANFIGKDISGLYARGINFTKAAFTRSTGMGMEFVACTMNNIDAEGMNATGSRFIKKTTLRDAVFKNATLDNAEFTDVDVTNIKVEGASVTGIIQDQFTEGNFVDTVPKWGS